MTVELGRLDAWTNNDWANAQMIVLFGWFILFLGAEAHIWTHRGSAHRLAPRQGIGAIVSLIALSELFSERPSDDVTFALPPGLPSLGLVLLGALVWSVMYLVDRDRLPWRHVPLALAAPAAGIVLYQRIVDNQLDRMLGWAAIWAAAAICLALNVTLGVLIPRRRPAAVVERPQEV